jgi:hypothetical protein
VAVGLTAPVAMRSLRLTFRADGGPIDAEKNSLCTKGNPVAVVGVMTGFASVGMVASGPPLASRSLLLCLLNQGDRPLRHRDRRRCDTRE